MDAVKLRPVLVFSVLRLLSFLVPLGILLLLPIFRQNVWLAAVFAAVIGLALSMLFLRRPLDQVTSGMTQRRERPATVTDEDVEDTVTELSGAEDDSSTLSADERPEQDRRVAE